MPPPPTALRITLAGFVALAVAMGIGRFAFTPLLPLMLEERLVTVPGGGILASVHFLGYGVGAVLAARPPRSPHRALSLSLLAIAAATAGMGLTANFTLWMVLRGLTGVCSAFVLVLVSKHALRSLAAQPHLQGWVFSGVGAGILFAGLGTLGLMAPEVASALGWQIFGVAALAASVAVYALTGRMQQTGVDASAASDRATPRTPLAWRLVLAYGAAGIGYIIPATYLPVMAREAIAAPLIFGWGWPLFGAAAFLSTLVSARLHAAFANRQIWATAQIAMAAGLLLPALYPGIVTVLVAGAGIGGTFMIITMAGMKEAHRIAPAHDVQRHIAALTAAFAIGQMTGPVLAAWAYDVAGNFSAPLVATSLVLAVTAAGLIRRSPRKEMIRP